MQKSKINPSTTLRIDSEHSRTIKIQDYNIKTKNFLKILSFGLSFWILVFGFWISLVFAQEGDLEFTLDVTAETVSLPRIFKPNIDLSGRGFHHQVRWPQMLAAKEVLDKWQKDIGFAGIYRVQYNLWEINQLAKDKEAQEELLGNYENIIRSINEANGLVILDIFGTPAGLGRVLDKKSPPWNLKAFKELIKDHIRNLSCNKRYNIWYEVWSAPDLEDFFLGRKQEYLNLYRIVAEAIKELESEVKIHIPLGGPGVSWWFQNLDGNNVTTPERSLIYELIKFSSHEHLPLDFITWHCYSTDPKAEKQVTIYNKTSVALIRDWLSYFGFNRDTPLIVDEWNYDSGGNILLERGEKSNVAAGFIPARLKNMYEAGIDYQLFFSLEDFQNNKEGVVRNVGIFWFDQTADTYKGSAKSIYNVFRMLAGLGGAMFKSSSKLNDEFVGVIPTKKKDTFIIIFYNYIDPDIFINYISRNISSLNSSERKVLLNLIKSDTLAKIMRRELDISLIRSSGKIKTLLNKALELHDSAVNNTVSRRNLRFGVKNLKEDYLYQRFVVDSSCSRDCGFAPVEEKEIKAAEFYEEPLTLNPFSVHMIVLTKKPLEPKSPATSEQTAGLTTANATHQTKEAAPISNVTIKHKSTASNTTKE